MKLTGNKRKGKHVDGKNGNVTAGQPDIEAIVAAGEGAKKNKRPRRKLPLILAIIFGVIVVTGVCGYFYVRTALDTRPPVRLNPIGPEYITPVDPTKPSIPSQSPGASPVKNEDNRERDATKYTFLLLATDEGGGNTDVIMVASFDTTDRSLEIVSIPRDTLMNVSWGDPKKANSVYPNMRYKYGWEDKVLSTVMDSTVEAFADILGFEVDNWFLVDMRAFIALIEEIGGVDFYVPVDMNYHDYDAGLHINYTKGLHHLSGSEALEVMRYRQGYNNHDIGRINTQQSFLMSAAQQILAKIDASSIPSLAGTFLKYVKTNIELTNLIWFGNQFLKLDMENINFNVMPGNYSDYVGSQSYVTIYLDEWLEMINEKIYTFTDEIKPENVSILTRGSDRYLYVTDGDRKGDPSWGAYSTGIISTSTGAATSTAPATSGNEISKGSSVEAPGISGEDPELSAIDDPEGGLGEEAGSEPTDGIDGPNDNEPENQAPPDSPPPDAQGDDQSADTPDPSQLPLDNAPDAGATIPDSDN